MVNDPTSPHYVIKEESIPSHLIQGYIQPDQAYQGLDVLKKIKDNLNHDLQYYTAKVDAIELCLDQINLGIRNLEPNKQG
jgi:hypothetical protein